MVIQLLILLLSHYIETARTFEAALIAFSAIKINLLVFIYFTISKLLSTPSNAKTIQPRNYDSHQNISKETILYNRVLGGEKFGYKC
jgi:hypothetical protein